MYTANRSNFQFFSQKSIEDQFIDDCLKFDCFSCKDEEMQTGLRVSTQKQIPIHQFQSQKSLGRWTIEQSIVYLDTIKNCHQTKYIVKSLTKKLPQRVETQIRAHHQKMIRKYGTIEQIIRCLDRQQNPALMQVNSQLSNVEQRLARLTKFLQ